LDAETKVLEMIARRYQGYEWLQPKMMKGTVLQRAKAGEYQRSEEVGRPFRAVLENAQLLHMLHMKRRGRRGGED
jgi:hypothetical protein